MFDLQDGQFWLVRDDEIVVAKEVAEVLDVDEPYVVLDIFLDTQETLVIERGVKFVLEVV